MAPTTLIISLHATDEFVADFGILAQTEDADWEQGANHRADDGALDMSKLPGCRMLALSFSADVAAQIKVTKRRGEEVVESFLLRSETVPLGESRGPIEVPVCGHDIVDFKVLPDALGFDFFQLEAVYDGGR